MTATPIPRTLAITAYGEMDVQRLTNYQPDGSRLRPLGCVRIQVGQVYRLIRSQVQAGSQVFAITPLIAESEKVDLQNAEQLFADMQKAVGGCGASCLASRQNEAG